MRKYNEFFKPSEVKRIELEKDREVAKEQLSNMRDKINILPQTPAMDNEINRLKNNIPNNNKEVKRKTSNFNNKI